MLASEFLRHLQPRSAWRPVERLVSQWLGCIKASRGSVVAEVGLRPDRLTDAEDRTLARLRALRPGLALS